MALAGMSSVVSAKTEQPMTLIEFDELKDLIFPWDAQWPMINTGINFEISGSLIGETYIEKASTHSDVYGNPIPGDRVKVPVELYFD